MRILFLHCARDWSGTARAFGVAARGLAARGYDVTLLVEPHSSVEQSASRMATVAQRLAGDDPVAPRDMAPFEVVPFSNTGSWLAAAWRLRHLFRRWDTDIVFVHTDREHLIAAAACWLGRSGRIVRRTATGTRLRPRFAGRFAGWLTPTTYLFSREEDLQSASVPGKSPRAAIARLGVDTARYPDRLAAQEPRPEDIRYIICVYDPTSRGRAATAIRTIAMLAPRHPYLRLLIFGPGSDTEDLRMQAAALDVMHLVSFLGERDDHLTLMRDAEIGWVVADGDTAAFGILDLMALGVPVLAAEGSVAETFVANLINGSLIASDDAYTAAATVVTLLAGEEDRQAMGAAGRARVAREFPEHAMLDGFEAAVAAASGRAARKG